MPDRVFAWIKMEIDAGAFSLIAAVIKLVYYALRGKFLCSLSVSWRLVFCNLSQICMSDNDDDGGDADDHQPV